MPSSSQGGFFNFINQEHKINVFKKGYKFDLLNYKKNQKGITELYWEAN